MDITINIHPWVAIAQAVVILVGMALIYRFWKG